MKKHFFIILTFVFMLSCNDSATNSTGATIDDNIDNDFISAQGIDKWIADLSSNTNLIRTEEEYNCEGWGGTVTNFKENESLVMLEHLINQKNGIVTTTFYYYNNELIKIYADIGVWAGTTHTASQYSYYLKDEQPFKITKKEAKSTEEAQIAENIAAAPLVDGVADELEVIKRLGTELKALNLNRIQDYFCK